MNGTRIRGRADEGVERIALESQGNEEERRIRQAMRVKANPAAKKTGHALPATAVGGAALLAGGFCLGWTAFRLWHD